MSRDLEKSLKDYEEIFGRPTPVRYNVLHFSDDHRRMDALLRRHFDAFHPLVRDIFTSFSLEFSILLEKVENLEDEMEYLLEETREKQKQLDDDLDQRIVDLKSSTEGQKQLMKDQSREIDNLKKVVEEQQQQLKEKEALIVTQRRQLDMYIDEQTKFQTLREEQKQQLGESIASVSEFTDQLILLETQMKEMEDQRAELQDSNRELTSSLQETEDQYIQEINEISKLYNSLKSETTNLYSKIEKMQSERDKYRSQVNELKDHYEELEAKTIAINFDNKTLKDDIDRFEKQLAEKDKELSEVVERNKKFKKLAKRILELKDKVDWDEPSAVRPAGEVDKEVKIVHPAEPIPVKKWTPKKTALEAELEQENVFHSPSKKDYELIERDVELDSSVFRLKSKLSETREHDLLSSIKQSIRSSEDHVDMTQKLDQEVKKAEDELNDKLDFSTVEADVTTPNLSRLLAKLDSNKVNVLNLIAEDFPKPPQNYAEDEKAELKKKSSKKRDRTPMTG